MNFIIINLRIEILQNPDYRPLNKKKDNFGNENEFKPIEINKTIACFKINEDLTINKFYDHDPPSFDHSNVSPSKSDGNTTKMQPSEKVYPSPPNGNEYIVNISPDSSRDEKNGLQIVSKKFKEIKKIHLLEFIESDEKLLIIGSLKKGEDLESDKDQESDKNQEKGDNKVLLKFIIWDLYDTGKYELMKKQDQKLYNLLLVDPRFKFGV
uniref:Uncharacterized protein n=1 Tax=Rhizophagus irregularis (strain DAOM 181602 / DAOM 197198 / MUCL 43194) TaxID=747089 RepID=U9T4F2_RHIID